MATESTASPVPAQIADGANKIRHVFIRDLVIDCSIGIYTHEKEHEQRVRINLDLAVGEGDMRINDDIRNVISYEDMAKGIEAIIAQGHINLVETLAEKIADMCLQDQRVSVARVRVEKLDIIANAASVGVEIERVKNK
ncbi:MAG: dihydroneopterin aldolase [Rhodospirillales bacterium]|nr:dihydroneopterin aldolase [Rhodospirillales bacterium]